MAEDKENPMSNYFAAKEAKQTASTLLNRSRSFYTSLDSNGYLDKIKKMYKFYHGDFNDDSQGHQINQTGEQGEYTSLPINHFRNLGQHIFNMVTSNRPIMEARSINTDYKSLAQTYLANGILEYYMREKHLEDAIKKALEMSIVMGSGYIKLEWNATAGEAYDVDPETGEFNYEGEIEFSNISPLDVVFDGTKENWNHDWILTRSWKNKYNIMAKYPELAQKIEGLPTKSDDQMNRSSFFSNDETEDVAVYEFFHKKTEALPEGRYILFLSADVILLDTKMPYRNLPVFRIAPNDYLGTTYGYSPLFDVFPIQEALNALYSTIMTNQNTFGVQNLFVQRGADINVNTLDGNMNVIEGNHKPEPLNLTQTPPEVFEFTKMLEQQAETISGVNSVTRGNPEASLKSGTALALVQSMSLQFISGLQQSYVKMIEDVGGALINILKDFAATPRVIAIVGKNNRPYLKEFTGDKVSDINRVIVDVGNPLSRTIAGRVQMAEQLLQMKLLKTPEQYFQILETGKIQNAYEGEMSELLLVKSENEQMLSGVTPIVSPLDKHRLHINEHKAVLSDPDLRQNQELVKTVLDHIEQHLNALRTTDPDLLALVGEQPLGPVGGTPANQAPPQGMPPQQGAPSDMITQQGQTLPQAGEMVQGQGNPGSQLPSLPTPPPPFENLPTQASDLVPQ